MAHKIAVLSAQQRVAVFGEFNYREVGKGRIKIDPGWVARNLVRCFLAKADGRGNTVNAYCHRLAKEPLEQAFAEISESGLWKLIQSFDGLWVPRHMRWDSSRPLSSHSWGIAFDLNAATNPYGGSVSSENRTLNEIFSRHGFAWGGDWNRFQDGMHWELADLQATHWTQGDKNLKKQAEVAKPRLILAVKHDKQFSYHAVPHAAFREGHFYVDAATVGDVLGKVLDSQIMPLRQALQLTGSQIIDLKSHLNDSSDPRYYVFVTTSSSKGSIPQVRSTA